MNLNDILDLDAVSQATITRRGGDGWELTVPVLPTTHTDDARRAAVSDYVQSALDTRVTTRV